jgi:hypothetical protein
MKDFQYLMTSAARISHFMRENADGSTTFAASQDTSAILDANQAMRSENDGYTPSRDFRRVASVPFAILYQWAHEEGWPDPMDPPADAFMRKLNDSDWGKLRTADGRLGLSNGVMR